MRICACIIAQKSGKFSCDENAELTASFAELDASMFVVGSVITNLKVVKGVSLPYVL